jgi:hypothetical protein
MPHCGIYEATRRKAEQLRGEQRPRPHPQSSSPPRAKITAGLFDLAVHPLLYNDPVAVDGGDEPMQVKLETVLKCGAVDLRYQAAG